MGLGLGFGIGFPGYRFELKFWNIGLGLDFIPTYVVAVVHIWTSTRNIRTVRSIHGLSSRN